MQICSLASGSSGNCYFIGTEKTNILVDAGISCREICKRLEENIGISGKDLDGIFITHEHNDHIQSLGVLARKFELPLYATRGTWKGLKGKIGKVNPDLCNELHNKCSMEIQDLYIEWFPTSHDANEPIGFLFQDNKCKVGLATDSGIITNRIVNTLYNVDLLILESNYDDEMLLNGKYPWFLKKRIKGFKGHLSNYMAGKALVEMVGEKTKSVILAHLSKENNIPSLALTTVKDVLEENGVNINFDLEVAPRHEAGKCIRL